MILFGFIVLLFILNLSFKKELNFKLIFFSIYFPLFLFLLWYIEFYLTDLSFFISDENFYINSIKDGFPGFSDRFLWKFINYIIYNYDIYFSGISLKLFNVPIFAFFIYYLRKTFNDKNIYLLPLILPYTAWLSIFNLRDISIHLFTLLSLYLFYQNKKFTSIIILILLYLSRPFMVFIIIFTIIIFENKHIFTNLISYFTKRKWRLFDLLIFMSAPLLLVIIYYISSNVFAERIVRYYEWFNHLMEYGMPAQISLINFPYYLIRYVFTPLPTSLLRRISDGGSTMWGLLDDFIRFYHQVFYYIILTYIFINIKFLYKTFKKLMHHEKIICFVFTLYWPIYSFYRLGAPHQRQKIPFQIVIFIIFLKIINTKFKIMNRR